MAGENGSGPDGPTQLQTMLNDGVGAPIGQTLGFELLKFEPGRLVLEGEPHRSVCNLYDPNLDNAVLELETHK